MVRGKILKTNRSGQRQQLWVQLFIDTENTTNLQLLWIYTYSQEININAWKNPSGTKKNNLLTTYSKSLHATLKTLCMRQMNYSERKGWPPTKVIMAMASENQSFFISKSWINGETWEINQATSDTRFSCCPTCAYYKTTRKPGRNKMASINSKILQIQDNVLIDSFESSKAGLTAQLKGSLTNKRYKVAYIFIDRFSDLSLAFRLLPFLSDAAGNSSMHSL